MLSCCGSLAWARCVAGARPIGDREQLFQAAEECWQRLDEADWIEAFAAHPRIGDRGAAGPAAREQSGVAAASGETLEALARTNREYEERFGRIFLVAASGKTAHQMLALCRQRLENDAGTELRVSAEEQKKITRLRLERWLAS